MRPRWQSFIALAFAGGLAASAAQAGELALRRIALSFAGGGATATVARGATAPLPTAEVAYGGAGLLQGRWEVDGRALAQVSQHLGGPGPAVVRLPEGASLPTFEPGTHVVRLVLEPPANRLPAPSLLYFVLPEGAAPGQAREIAALEPADGHACALGPLLFSWERIAGDPVYLVEFLEERAGRPVFTAFAAEPRYSMPAAVSRAIFTPGRMYWWKATGYDAASRAVGATPPRCFVFR